MTILAKSYKVKDDTELASQLTQIQTDYSTYTQVSVTVARAGRGSGIWPFIIIVLGYKA